MSGWLPALLIAGSFFGGAGTWALITRLSYGLPADDGGGPEADQLIAEAGAAWRANVADRIASRLAIAGWIRSSAGTSTREALSLVTAIVLRELEG